METRECKWCRGTGRARVDNLVYPCEDCGGTGEEYYCPVCEQWRTWMETDVERGMCFNCIDKMVCRLCAADGWDARIDPDDMICEDCKGEMERSKQ